MSDFETKLAEDRCTNDCGRRAVFAEERTLSVFDKRIAAARELLCSVDGHDFLEMVHSRRCRKCGLKERND